MGASGPVLSSAAGPAKWAAVIVLAFASGAGLTWSAVRGRVPPARQAPAPERRTATPPVTQTTPVSAPSPPQPTAPASLPVSAPKPETQIPQPSEPPPAPVETLPAAPAAPEATSPDAPARVLTHRVNLNTAGQAELELLPGVGPALAKRIMDYRTLHGPFKAIADLDKVKGIGPKILAKIAPLVTVE